MSKPVVEVRIRAMAAVKGGFAVFIGNEEKVFAMVVEQSIGTAITEFLQGQKSEWPLTRDLLANVMCAFEPKIERIVFHDLKQGAYLAKIVLKAEIKSEQRMIEIDARPGECLALAAANGAPIFVGTEVWSQVEDVKGTLQKLEEESSQREEIG